MDEYEGTQRLQELWTRSIMTWGQVLIPLGVVIIAFFVTQAGVSERGGHYWDFKLLIIGWGLFAICMVFWRWVVHNLDERIVGLYPILLRIEKTNKWDTYTRYYFNNLANRSRRHIRHILGLERLPTDYDDFVDEARHQGLDQYGLLLSVWREYGWNSAGDRGHKIQDIAVFSLLVLFLILVLWLEWGAGALSALILFALLVLWGRHRGWWFV